MNKCYFWILYVYFFCIVLLNARPMFKSMEYDKTFKDKANTLNRQHFKLYGDKCQLKTNLITSPNVFEKKHMKFKRKVNSKELDLNVFNKFKTTLESKNLMKSLNTNVENSTSILPTLSTKIYKLQRLYIHNNDAYMNTEKNINIYQNSNIFDKNHVSTMSINVEFLGTAEIEAVLNDIKQREIQMIVDQEPSVTNVINNAVTETSFTSIPFVTQSNIFPSNAFSNFLFVSCSNNNLTETDLKKDKRKIHNEFIRSIKEDSYTMAYNIENKLQNQLKKTYCKVKAQLRKEFNKEIKESKATIKENIKKFTNKGTTKKVCSLPHKSAIKLKTKELNKNLHMKGIKFCNATKSMGKFNKGKLSISTRKIQMPEDEQLLAISNVNNSMYNNKFTTHSTFDNKDSRMFFRNSKTNFIQETNENLYKDVEEIPDVVENTDINKNENNLTTSDEITEKCDRSHVTADANYQALSNKISFNDYVNGYKYYLNFQKDNDDEKYSNLVRYQAHKHHNVDDIGKFILTKIPRLPTTRLRRYFVEVETLEDQDISTKSEDSWFKKHFFVYLDTNPPRKFHTSQTVPLKAPDLQMNEWSTARANTIYTHKMITLPETKTISLTRRQRRNNHSYNLKSGYCVKDTTIKPFLRKKTKSDFEVSYYRKKKKRNNLHKIYKRKIYNKNSYEEKLKTLSSMSHRKNGFVNIDLVHRSTGVVKLNKNNKRKRKLQNLFKKIRINRRKLKKIEKGQNNNREQRHIFKSLRNIFSEKSKNEIQNEPKLDYKIVPPEEKQEAYNNNFNSLKLLNVDDILKQIPTITGDFTYPYHFLQPEVYNNEKLYFSKIPELDLKTKSFPLLSGNKISFSKIEPNTFPLSKHIVYDSDHFKQSSKNKLCYLNKHTQDKYDNSYKDIGNKKIFPISARISKNTIIERYTSGKMNLKSTEKMNVGKKPNKDKSKQLNKSVFEQWVPINKVAKISHSVPIPISVSTITKRINHAPNELLKNNIDDTIFHRKVYRGQNVTQAFQNFQEKAFDDNNSYTVKRSQNKGIYNTKKSKPSIRPIAQVNAPPEHYFTTFLPMQIEDFHKFLKEKEIDVESVTAPLEDSLSRRLDSWSPKINKSNSKIKERMQNTKKYIMPKLTCNTQSLDSSISQYQNQNHELHFGEDIYDMNDHDQYETTRSQKSVYDRLKQIKTFTRSYLTNILPSQQDLNVRDLDTKIYNPNFAVKPIEKEEHQNDKFTLNDRVSDKYFQLSMPNEKRDPLRFSHISTEGYFSKYFNNNKATTKPERVHISGHSYKYDIIYHKGLSSNDKWNSDDYADIDLTRNKNNDNIFSSIIEKPKLYDNIHIDKSRRNQRGSIEARQKLYLNSENKKLVKKRKFKLFHKKEYKENKVTTKNTKYRNISTAVFDKKNQLPITKNYDSHNIPNDICTFMKVYVEPKSLHKTMKQKSTIADERKSKHEKRNAQEGSFTAKDVAALEVVVDLLKNYQAYDGKDGNINAFFDKSDHKSMHHSSPTSPKEKQVTNSIQVHIAIPYNTDDKKRSLEPVRLRKVFSAIMSTPVDLEYQIHSFEETTTTPKSIVQDVLTPGLYLLVENTNKTCPEGNFVLKPIKYSLEPSKLAVRYVPSTTKKQNNSPSSFNVESVSFNKDFIDAVNKVMHMNENLAVNNTNSNKKRSISTETEKNEIINAEIRNLVQVKKRNMNWDAIKKYFGHDRVCHCYCKANQTMCRECAACNAIISELMFELENLAKYMTQHCTEIQTFFWMNPSGGRKLRDVIHRIDTILSDYYRRVKGKCKGRTCQTLSSNIDKRSLNNLYYNDNLVNRLSGLAGDLENALKYKIFNNKILVSGTELLNMAKGCMQKRLHKRSGNNIKQPLEKNIYSLNNIKVNLICNKKFTKPTFVARNTMSKGNLEKNIVHPVLYYDDEEINNGKKNKKGIKAFLKKCSIKKKNRTKKSCLHNGVIRNWRAIDQIDDYKHKRSIELNGHNMIQTDSLSHNMNELFKLLNNVDPLETLTTTKSSFFLNLTTKNASHDKKIGTTALIKLEHTLSQLKIKDNLKRNSLISSEKIKKITNSFKTTLSLTTTTKSATNRSNKSKTKCSLNRSTNAKFNLLNILKSLKFLPKKEEIINKMNTPENRPVRSRIPKYKKHRSKTEKVKDNLSHNGKATNNITDVVSAIIINDDDDDDRFSDESLTAKKPFNKFISSNPTFVTISTQDEIVKPDYMKLYPENNNDTNSESINDALHFETGTRKTITSKNYKYDHNDNNILQILKNVHHNIFNYTVSSVEPKKYKGFIDKIGDQFVIKILSDSENKKGCQKCRNCDIATNGQKGAKFYLQSVGKEHEQCSSENVKEKSKLSFTKPVSATTTTQMTIEENKKKGNIKEKGTQNISNIVLKEADDRNKICDIDSTVNHVVKMHDSMPKNNFEQYVTNISCYKYTNMPNYISVKYNIKNGNKKHAKYRRKCKTYRKDYDNKILKWNWVREKRSLVLDDIRVELDDYEDSEKFKNSESNMAAYDISDSNGYKIYKTDVIDNKCNKIITTLANANIDQQNQKYFNESLHQIGKKSVHSNSYRLINKNDYQLTNLANKNGEKREYFELFFKRKDGIYQQILGRRKRSDTNNISNIRRVLQNLPPLRPLSDEIFVTMGDSVSFRCHQPGNKHNQSMSDYIFWNAERKEMLDHENIVVDGSKIFLRDVGTKNFGTYVCSKGNVVIRSIKLTITSIPSFNIVFTPVYRIDSACTYNDLKAVQLLGSAIPRDCCGEYCSVRIDEPICLKDRINDLSYLRPIIVVSLNAIPNINCSCECKRNLMCSLVRLLLSNMPSLAFVKVLISFDGMRSNKTLTPLIISKRRSFVTHTLRRKVFSHDIDSNGHHEYHDIAADMEPGNFNLLLLCPAGFYLIFEQKICVVCPSNTFSKEGDNECRVCPQGTRATPGSRSCRMPFLRSRRFAWNANEWSIVAFCALALSAFAIFYGAIRLLRHAWRPQGNNARNSRGNILGRSKTCQKSPMRRPLSPSHVILNRLLRSSLTSSQAADSQENREFELWKEKNTLPPLPPIDFDL